MRWKKNKSHNEVIFGCSFFKSVLASRLEREMSMCLRYIKFKSEFTWQVLIQKLT